MSTSKYWGKTIASFLLVLFTMPLGHALNWLQKVFFGSKREEIVPNNMSL